MKRISVLVLPLLLAPSLFADAGKRLIPAGSLVSCTTGDARISSKTTAVGDPVLCKVEHRRGDYMLPYGSYLGGEFSEYKDPGHFIGKGYMELSFDRLYVGDTVFPIDAKVVNVPGYRIDSQGRVLGKGHAVRDTITWMIPILWPIDLMTLPRRGPKPTLKAETALTLRVMDDTEVPIRPEPERDPDGLIRRGDQSYVPDPPRPADPQPAAQMSYNQAAPDPAPEMSYQQVPPDPEPPVQYAEPAPTMAYAAPAPVWAYPMPAPVIAYAVPAPVMAYAPVYVASPPILYGGYPIAYNGFAMGPAVAVSRYRGVYAPARYPRYGVRAYAPARTYRYGYAMRGY
ncbi:MAG TPA: hypothetical protein VF730_01865 [Terracidiphilus sp.]